VTREDDKLETVKKRLKVYAQQTLNLVDYYESKGLLRRIDGSGLIDDVVARVVQVIE
jgi:adenylate kinase